MYCYLDFCWVLPPLVGDLVGTLIGLALWGKRAIQLLEHTLTSFTGFYVWMLRRKRSKHTPALIGIVGLLVLNLVQTGKPLSLFLC